MAKVQSPILNTLSGLFRNVFRKPSAQTMDRDELGLLFRKKYSAFKQLLESNAELLQIVSDIQEKLRGETIFGMSYVGNQATRAMFHTARMVSSLRDLSGKPYTSLEIPQARLRQAVADLLGAGTRSGDVPLVLDYGSIGKEMVDAVGGKSANLGEMASRVGLPIPDGFAVTTAGYWAFVRSQGLLEEIGRLCRLANPQDTLALQETSETIQRLFLTTPLPPELDAAITEAYQALCRRQGRDRVALAMRSSAIGEDSDLSFAGQYLTILNVPLDRLAQSYRLILASLFTPRAIYYRHFKGISVDGVAMSVACLEMVEAKASGVAYTSHPFNPLDRHVLINALWGLGPSVVDGLAAPDVYVCDREQPPRLVRSQVAHKAQRLVRDPSGGLLEEPVAPELQDVPCLTQEQAVALAASALRLEEHFGAAQDIEWALDPDDQLIFLQSRPLTAERSGQPEISERPEPVAGVDLLLDTGDIASPGVGCGPVHLVRSDADLASFPEGGVLVADHSSPSYVVVLRKAQAVVTDAGSVTGHMAALVREFGVPAIFNTRQATGQLPPGSLVTVDALTGRVYAGQVDELLALRRDQPTLMEGTPVYQTLARLADLIVPLHLTDPRSPEFLPDRCRTVHDIMRFIHEKSYGEMFNISDSATDVGQFAYKLNTLANFDLYVIDLGGGLRDPNQTTRRVDLDHVTSVPFLALLDGLLHPAFQGSNDPRPINVRGLLSVMNQQLLTAPAHTTGERFGDRSYALISDKYLNFSSRVGYHYGILDCYCGKTVNKNYINFSFAGGAAGEDRRARRARAIGRILEQLDFTIEVTMDRVVARYQKYEEDEIRSRLDQLGRLLQFTRQMDMLMESEASIDLVSRCFLEGNYGYCTMKLAEG